MANAFAVRLTQLSNAKQPDLAKYVEDVNETCLQEAAKGFAKARCYVTLL